MDICNLHIDIDVIPVSCVICGLILGIQIGIKDPVFDNGPLSRKFKTA